MNTCNTTRKLKVWLFSVWASAIVLILMREQFWQLPQMFFG